MDKFTIEIHRGENPCKAETYSFSLTRDAARPVIDLIKDILKYAKILNKGADNGR